MATKNGKNDSCCDFCGAHESQVLRLFKGPDGVSICNECVSMCNRYMGDVFDTTDMDMNFSGLPKPKEIKAIL